jgi:single-strand DNA-binding protein
MANDINKVVIIGRLTRDLGSDPNGRDFQYTQSGMCIAKFSIAVKHSTKGQNGQYVEEADFFNVTMFGKYAETLKPFMTKGKQICVVGKLKQERWTDQQGQNHTSVSIVADEVQLLGGQNQQGYQQSQQTALQQSYQQTQQTQPTYPQQGGYQQQNYPQQNGYQSQPQSVAQPMIQQPQQPFAGEEFPEDIPF